MSDDSTHRDAGTGHAATAAVVTMAVVVVAVALELGRELLVPVVLAAILVALLEPVVALLRRARVPRSLGAALVTIGSVGLLVAIGLALERPARTFAAEVPRSVVAARARLARIGGPIAQLGGAPGARATPSDTSRAQRGAQPSPSLGPAAGRALGITSSVLSGIVEVLLLAFFVLAAGESWRDRVERAVRSPTTRRATLDAAREMRAAVSRYLVVTALINLGQAVVVTLVVRVIGLPGPVLWGALTFVLEFVPYLGGAVMIGLLLVSGLAADLGLGRALAAPAAYLVITTLQNNLVSPAAYGRGLRLNPTAILLSVALWWMLWGVAGAFVAVPILAAMRILARYVPALEPLGAFVEE